MNWDLIFWNALVHGDQCRCRRLLHHRRRIERPRRLHRPAQLRPGRIRCGRRLRVLDPDRRVRLVVVLGAAVDARVLGGAGTPAWGSRRCDCRADYLAIVTIADRRDHPAVPELDAVHVVDRRHRRPQRLDERSSRISIPIDNTARFNMGAQSIDGYRLFMMIVGWALVVLISLFIWALMRSPWGRVLKSIREDEDAAGRSARTCLAFKMQSLVLGGVIGSIGGLWLSAQKQSAQTGEFATTLTFFAFLIIVLGGLGRVKGPIVGTHHLLLRHPVRRQPARAGHAQPTTSPDWLVDSTNFGVVKNIVAGLVAGPTGGLPPARHLRRQA